MQMLGTKLVGRYEIIRNLGEGGFGETYIACDTQLPGSPQCVVKKLKPLADDLETLQTARRLFDTEAKVLFQLGNHPQIPQLLAYFEDNHSFYLVQELIVGEDLAGEFIPHQPWNQQQVVEFLQQILTILDFVHQQNVIHRDINPRNIIRRSRDRSLVLIDFGAVKQITTNIVNTQMVPQNRTVVIGTPGYMSAEQAQGNPCLSSDVYGVGILAIQALTGVNPTDFPRHPDTYEIAWRDICPGEVDGGLADLIDKMVCHDFRMRYSCAGAVLTDLQQWMQQGKNTATLALAPPSGGVTPVRNSFPRWKKSLMVWMVSAVGLTAAGLITAAFVIKGINTANSSQFYEQANTLYDLNRYEDALQAYNKALEMRDNFPQAWYGKGKVLSALKRDREALAAYDRAIQLEPDLLDAWGERGLVLVRLQRYNEAISAFDRVLAVDGKNATIWNAKGNALSQLNQLEQAIKAYDEAIGINPENPGFYYHKALALQKLNRFDDAVTNYDKAINLHSNSVNTWYQRGNALFNLQRYQDALASYQKAVELKPDFVAAWLSQANILMNQRRYQDAIASFTQVNKLNPRNYTAWYGKGWSLHQLQRYDEAITAYNQAIALRPNHYQAHYNLGNVFYQQQKYSAALAAYNRSLRADDNHPEAWFAQGNAYFNLQQYTNARTAYERAIALKPDYQAAINARNQVEEILKNQSPTQSN
ncbi:tetratricopeptide repeat protein [Calothrix sp. NIES-3974]|uniref:tetratricopeptide repeat protein n=1 Tax=Calothrix sp. NIES-3974 TaxID=2005462 RepID=UPI000B5EF4A9|nr:tetratricopeptide repeat protein [Calothrix sp. NIES-3974]BAZ04016.1 TPR repeat-containing serine/threonine protein kinase [Calothrix sp. NIES-3974]